MVVAMETGGRWSEEATDFISSLAVSSSSGGCTNLAGCWLFLAGGRSRHLWSLLVQPAWMVKTGIRP